MALSAAQNIRKLAYECLLDLATEEGINASGRDEIYGCIFGRDSAITVLKILNFLQNDTSSDIDRNRLISICKTVLLTLIDLQGTTFNKESGEEPGKFIHEYRKDKYDHLLALERPWFLYSDKKLRNYDSIDATPLALIAMYRYFKLTGDGELILKALPSVERGLNWIISYGDSDRDYLVEYEFPKDRKHGGLLVQSWTDSHQSLRQANGEMPLYPIAPVEVQGYTWLALKLWADYYREENTTFSNTEKFAQKLSLQADHLKKKFNELFLFEELKGEPFPAQALDGDKNQIKTITGNSLLLLWSTYKKNGKKETILNEDAISYLVKRSFLPDMFDKDAGIRTMSMLSPTFNPNKDSYHNGSFWPKLNGMCHEGLAHWGFHREAAFLREATIKPISYFNSPIELYIKNSNGEYVEYDNGRQIGCRTQAWSAAVALDLTY